MTNEEAIKVLLDEWKCIDRNDGINCDRKCENCDLVMDSFVLKDAYNMAIKALEQQSMPTMVYPQVEGITPVVVEPIPKLPPVNQQEPTGHWIMPVQDDGMSDPIYYQVRCSECGFDLDPQTWHMELHQYGADKYCPKCGAKMAESEDKK